MECFVWSTPGPLHSTPRQSSARMAAFSICTVCRASVDSVVSPVPLESWLFTLINCNLKSQLWPVVPTGTEQPGIPLSENSQQGLGLGAVEARGNSVKMGPERFCPKCVSPAPWS